MKFLNHFLLLYFSIGAFIPNSDFSQLAHIDELMEHYALHQAEADKMNQSLSFTDFLYMHFIEGDDHEHSSGDEHQDLPLHTISSGMMMFMEQTTEVHNIQKICFQNDIITYQLSFNNNPFIKQIFHPPNILH